MKEKEILLLSIRSMIADKEMVIASANRELSECNAWSCDYQRWYNEINSQIKYIF